MHDELRWLDGKNALYKRLVNILILEPFNFYLKHYNMYRISQGRGPYILLCVNKPLCLRAKIKSNLMLYL